MNPKIFALLQHITPQHCLSRAALWVAECRNTSFKNFFIKKFIKQYKVDMNEALDSNPESYAHFNDFFTRELKEGMRPLDADSSKLVSPADGAVSQLGDIHHGRIFQAKGHDYSLTDLVGGDTDHAKEFMNGSFATIYLSPKDYHRVHMPCKGTLRSMTYVPGKLFSVNQATAENIPGLFARNERVVCIFDTEHGPLGMVLVGAMIVASIETVWAGLVTPQRREIKHFNYGAADREEITLERGEEMGRFKLGSTVILLLPKDAAKWQEELGAGTVLRMGQGIATTQDA